MPHTFSDHRTMRRRGIAAFLSILIMLPLPFTPRAAAVAEEMAECSANESGVPMSTEDEVIESSETAIESSSYQVIKSSEESPIEDEEANHEEAEQGSNEDVSSSSQEVTESAETENRITEQPNDRIAKIIIEEVAWAGSSASLADEWIELANLGEATATVGGWQLRGAGEGGKTIFLPPEATIGPLATYVIANYRETDAKSALAVPVSLATTTVSLSNAALGLELRDGDGAVVDRAGNGGTPFAGSASPNFATMIRVSATSTGDAEDGWTTATATRGYKADVAGFGTPGFCDTCGENAPPICPLLASSDESVADPPEASGEELSCRTSEPTNDGETDDTATLDESAAETAAPSGDEELSGDAETVLTPSDQTASEASSDQNASDEEGAVSAPDSTQDSVPGPMAVALNEIVSNPATGGEWIELALPESATATDRLLLLYDGSGKIATVATGTAVTAPGFLVVTLASAKLNNSGDEVSLREANGSALDWTGFGALAKGTAWARDLDDADDVWRATTLPTPGAANVFPAPPPASASANTSASASASTQPATTTAASSTAIATATSTASDASPSATGARLPVSINEIVSNPDGGPEWIELALPGSAAATDRDLLLYDATGKIATVAMGTPVTTPGYLVVTLASAKLNNSGDEASVRETDGVAIERVAFGKLAKGTSWAKDASGEWAVSETPTPGAANNLPAPEEVNASASHQVIESVVMSENSSDATSGLRDLGTTKKTSASAAKTTAAKKTTPITNLTFDMLTDISLNSVRARVSGTAGSAAGLLGASNAFVLLAEDGRGLIAYLPKHLHVPPLGSSVRLTGTLKVTVKGPELRMGTNDVWTSLPTSTPPVPRTVDLLALGEEDAWSLTTIEGTVKTVNTASFAVETDDGTDVTIAVPAAAGFRVKRLAKGDRVRVTGFADPRKASPTVIARSGLEITILEHAEGSMTPPSSAEKADAARRFPSWAPFGAAGGAIVATGAGKRLREILRKRKLKRVGAGA